MMLITPILVMALAGQALVDVDGGQLAAAGARLAQSRDTADPKDAADPSPPPLQKEELKEPPTPPHTGIRALFGNLLEDIKHLPAMQNVYVAGGGGVLALAAHPEDARFGVFMTNHYDTVNVIFAPGKYIGDTAEQVALSMGTYAFGRIFDKPKVSHFGMDLVQAQILTEMLVEPIKFAVGRPRPDGSNNQSFPSGHAAITFATATVIERHLGWRKSLLAYGIASYVAASRIHDNRHYLSDVIFGAAIGTVAGRTVVHHASDYWAINPVKVPGGVAIMITRNNTYR
jgi:PAP2 superfamily protein